jgi:(2Fe-2S) ferredoxin
MGTGCLSQHSDRLKDALAKECEAQGKNAFVRRTGCMGLCAAGPLALVDPEEILYQHLKADNAGAVIASLGGEPVKELQCDLREHFDQQVHVVLENSGHIDPEKIDDYIARDGYRALLLALNDMTPNGVIRQITEHRGQSRGRCKVHHLQRRRRRPRRIHGSQRS